MILCGDITLEHHFHYSQNAVWKTPPRPGGGGKIWTPFVNFNYTMGSKGTPCIPVGGGGGLTLGIPFLVISSHILVVGDTGES